MDEMTPICQKKDLPLGSSTTCRLESLEPCDDVCMCVVNKQFELLEFVSESVYVDLQYDEISHTFTAGSVCLCGVCGLVVVLGLSVRLSW